jgi:hypothetical protein
MAAGQKKTATGSTVWEVRLRMMQTITTRCIHQEVMLAVCLERVHHVDLATEAGFILEPELLRREGELATSSYRLRVAAAFVPATTGAFDLLCSYTCLLLQVPYELIVVSEHRL